MQLISMVNAIAFHQMVLAFEKRTMLIPSKTDRVHSVNIQISHNVLESNCYFSNLQIKLVDDFSRGFNQVIATNPSLRVNMEMVPFSRKESETAYQDMCAKLRQRPLTVLVDMTWGGWVKGRRTATRIGIPVIRLQVRC